MKQTTEYTTKIINALRNEVEEAEYKLNDLDLSFMALNQLLGYIDGLNVALGLLTDPKITGIAGKGTQ